MWVVPRQLTGKEPVIQTADSGPLVHSSNLTLANAKRDAGGLYTCTVSVRGGDHVLDVTVAQTITRRVLGKREPGLLSIMQFPKCVLTATAIGYNTM